MIDFLPPIVGFLLLFALLSLLWYSCLEPMIKSFRQPENNPTPSPLSSLKVGDCFTIVGDEEDLWQIVYFGWQGIRVHVVGCNRWEWLKYDLEVEKFDLINDRIVSLEVGDLFYIPEEENGLYRVLSFEIFTVRVISTCGTRYRWLKNDCKVKKVNIIRDQTYD